MKKIAYILAALIAGGCFVGCSDTMNESTGIGRLMLKTEISPEIKISRAIINGEEAEELANKCLIWISNSKGLVREYKGINSFPADGIWLTGGQYIAEAWSGDSIPASFDKRYFKGQQKFEIKSGNVDKVNLTCAIANVGVAVTYDESVDKVLKDVTLTVGHSAGSLTWTGKDERRGYFMMNSRDKDLNYVLKGKDEYGEEYTQEGTLKAVKPGTEYKLRVGHEGVDSNTGGAYFNIEIEETTMIVNHDIVIDSAPIITNRLTNGFDEPVYAEQGNVEYICIGVKSTVPLVGIVVELKGMADLLDMDGSDKFDILFLHDQGTDESNEIHQKLSDLGIDHETHEDEEFGDDMLIFFRSKLLNRLEVGTYPITVTAVDENGKVGTATLELIISDAVVKAEPMVENSPAVWANTATLEATVLKDTETAGFNYREKGAPDWNYVEGTPLSRSWSKGAKYYVKLTDLTPATTYEFVAVAGDFVSTDVQEFTTEEASQFPNSGFEEWTTEKAPYLIYSKDMAMFWDSGNHGSATMNKNVTVPDETIKHGGKYSIKLASQFVGIGALGKFAAGNVFIGEYLETKGTNGVLGWGRPWNSRPKQLKGYVRYEPVAITHDKPAQGYNKGDMDTGIIYIALLDGSMEQGNGTYPVVIDTSVPTLFNETNSDVIAYGKIEFSAATAGDGMVEFTIDLDYRRTDIKPSYIMCTASASKGGDYFAGGNGSVMYLDDLELVY